MRATGTLPSSPRANGGSRPKITRSDVARMAGVSPAVVSYVINDGPRHVSAAARARVEAAIEALDYRPDALANAFRDGHTQTVGLLIPSPQNPFYAEMAQAVGAELSRHGYLLSMGISSFNTHEDGAQLRSFEDRRMAGVLIGSGASLTPTLVEQSWNFPQVVLDSPPDFNGASVSSDGFYDARRAVDHLQMHGHEVIGCIGGPPNWYDCAARVNGWQDQQTRAGLPAGRDLVAYSEVSEQGGSIALRILMSEDSYRRSRRNDKPTAVFVNSDVQAFGVLRTCHELGIRVPDDLAIVSFDGVRASLFTYPRLTTMRRPLDPMVRSAIGQLIGGGDDTVGDTALKGNLIVGESCGCLPTIQWQGGLA
jgi:LacI family transcriptional regulator